MDVLMKNVTTGETKNLQELTKNLNWTCSRKEGEYVLVDFWGYTWVEA